MTPALPFTLSEVMAIHDIAIEKFGAAVGIRDENILESALTQPFQTCDGRDLHPSAVEKACRYAFGVVSDHPFIDGNKRTGTALMGAYLKMSGIDFQPSRKELLWAMLKVADGTLSYDGLVAWVDSVVL